MSSGTCHFVRANRKEEYESGCYLIALYGVDGEECGVSVCLCASVYCNEGMVIVVSTIRGHWQCEWKTKRRY